MIQVNRERYEVVEEKREGFNEEAFIGRFSDVLEKYDYIVGTGGTVNYGYVASMRINTRKRHSIRRFRMWRIISTNTVTSDVPTSSSRRSDW